MTKIKFYLYVLLTVTLAMLGLYGYGRSVGKRATELKYENKINESRKVARNVEDSVNAMGTDDVRQRMRDKWTRK